VKKETCDQLVSECEQSLQKMGLYFYEVMKKALELVERWKKYYPLVQEVWRNARSRERLAAALITGPAPNPEELERWLAFLLGLFHTSCAVLCRGLRKLCRRHQAVVHGS